jgi:hypothetical protein
MTNIAIEKLPNTGFFMIFHDFPIKNGDDP